eukprot:Transcript_26740.p1 GENE.Transcript_26740~~Transcript_26740.p1  ORF type:complete len:511 (+),score=190.37 Transcript_26740:162-1535(+)
MQGNLRHRAMQGACLTLLVAGIVVQTVRAAPTPSGTVKYGIVFDAGSSGSRIHVYSWRVGGGGPKDAFDLIADDLLKKKPGLSAYKDKPAEAGSSLRELLDHAKSKIPQNLHAETPVFLMATAGLRMVGETIKDQILASVCAELSSSGFLFQCEWATLLSGTDEGLYGWVTVNYLLDTLYPPANSPPVGIIDLGGGSVQVVFAASQGSGLKHMDFGGRTHDAYIKSHLGFGLDEARRRALDLVVDKANRSERPAHHPCLPKGATVEHKGMALTGDGDWAKCLKLTNKLFVAPEWSIADMPPLPASVYGFSYMYDRTAAIGLLDEHPQQFGSVQMSMEQIVAAGRTVCALDAEATKTRFAPTQDAPKANNYCGDAAYVAALLSNLGFAPSTSLTMTNKIKDVELVWTLGAMLAKSAELAAGGGSSSWLRRLLQISIAGGIVYLLCRCKAPTARDHKPL